MKDIKGKKERKNWQALRYEIKLLSHKMSWCYDVSRSTKYPANFMHHVLASRFNRDTICESYLICTQ